MAKPSETPDNTTGPIDAAIESVRADEAQQAPSHPTLQPDPEPVEKPEPAPVQHPLHNTDRPVLIQSVEQALAHLSEPEQVSPIAQAMIDVVSAGLQKDAKIMQAQRTLFNLHQRMTAEAQPGAPAPAQAAEA